MYNGVRSPQTNQQGAMRPQIKGNSMKVVVGKGRQVKEDF